MLNVNRLGMLRELSVLGTISAVADALNLTRPAVSQQLSLLEREVGTVLLERAGRSVALTEAGRRLVERTHELFATLESIESDLAASRGAVAGDLRISAFPSLASTVLPEAIAYLREKFPELRITLTEQEPVEGLRAVAARRVDVAIVDDVTRTDASSEVLDYHPLLEDHFHVVLPPRHRLAERPTVALTELDDEHWAINTAAHTYHSVVLQACQVAGFQPRVACDCRDTTTALEMVRTGWTVAVLPGLALHQVPASVHVRPLYPVLTRRVSMATARGVAVRPAVAAALAAVKAVGDRIQTAD